MEKDPKAEFSSTEVTSVCKDCKMFRITIYAGFATPKRLQEDHEVEAEKEHFDSQQLLTRASNAGSDFINRNFVGHAWIVFDKVNDRCVKEGVIKAGFWPIEKDLKKGGWKIAEYNLSRFYQSVNGGIGNDGDQILSDSLQGKQREREMNDLEHGDQKKKTFLITCQQAISAFKEYKKWGGKFPQPRHSEKGIVISVSPYDYALKPYLGGTAGVYCSTFALAVLRAAGQELFAPSSADGMTPDRATSPRDIYDGIK